MLDILDIGFISLDILVVLVLIAVLMMMCLKSGKGPVVTLIISMYPALVLTAGLPFITINEKMAEAVVFLVIYALVFLAIRRNVHVKKNHTHMRKMIDCGLLTLSYAILFLSVYIYAMPSLGILYTFSPQVVSLVVNIPHGVALILPILVIFFTNKSDLRP